MGTVLLLISLLPALSIVGAGTPHQNIPVTADILATNSAAPLEQLSSEAPKASLDPLSNGSQVNTASSDWPMYGYDAARTGYNPNETTLNPPLRIRWTYSDSPVGTSAVVANGTVYFGSADGKIYALDASTGAIKWSQRIGVYGPAYLAAENGTLYFGSDDQKAYAVDANTGALRWVYTTVGYIRSSPAVAGGVVYFSTTFGNVYALDATTGTLKWSVSIGGSVYDPAVADGVVYICNSGGKIRALDAVTGVVKWQYDTEVGVGCHPTVANGKLYVGSHDYKLYAFDAATGSVIWSYVAGSSISSPPTVANGTAFVVADNSVVYALDAGTGALKWSQGVVGAVSVPLAAANGAIYGVGLDSKVYALDVMSGNTEWSYSLGGGNVSSPIVAGGILYVRLYDRVLYAFETEYRAYLPALPRSYYYFRYLDDFSNSSSGWPTAESDVSRVGYLNGEYQILGKRAGYISGATPGITEANFTLEVDARPASSTLVNYGLTFGLNSNWTGFYFFAIRPTGYYSLRRYNNGTWQYLVGLSYSPYINQGQNSNNLKILRNGLDISIYVNGRLFTTSYDGTFSSGRLGVMIGALGDNADVRFDNFRVSSYTPRVFVASSPGELWKIIPWPDLDKGR